MRDIGVDSYVEGCTFTGNFRNLKDANTYQNKRYGALVGLRLAGITSVIGGSGLPNVFEDLGHGIDAENHFTTVSNSIFKNIIAKKVPSSLDPNFYYGGTAVQSLYGKVTLTGYGGNANDKPIFKDVSNGVYAYYSDFNITNAHLHWGCFENIPKSSQRRTTN